MTDEVTIYIFLLVLRHPQRDLPSSSLSLTWTLMSLGRTERCRFCVGTWIVDCESSSRSRNVLCLIKDKLFSCVNRLWELFHLTPRPWLWHNVRCSFVSPCLIHHLTPIRYILTLQLQSILHKQILLMQWRYIWLLTQIILGCSECFIPSVIIQLFIRLKPNGWSHAHIGVLIVEI